MCIIEAEIRIKIASHKHLFELKTASVQIDWTIKPLHIIQTPRFSIVLFLEIFEENQKQIGKMFPLSCFFFFK